MSDEDEDYHIPLQDQRVFGAGIKRKRIAFVPASSTSESILPNSSSNQQPQPVDIASRYLSIVLPKDSQPLPDRSSSAPPGPVVVRCKVCNNPIMSTDQHESTLAHQLCLTHINPPSHLDRSRVGVKYLESYGWDPDSRLGIGARNEGIRVPIKAKEKHDTEGLREQRHEDDGATSQKRPTARKENKVVRLDAKKVRLQAEEAKKRAERLRKSFYGPDLENYLGPNS
ncbi:uncharacterized protein PV06_09113 [Exophiala oligosperma]|uniref:G-patch domain-containing protein n=2 Tax=Chaetothyriales TaxID=34395 RepID=A0A0D2DA42_9EURO|nr:uncharacterized protein PV06_09113 [Exophiala oligosperma]KAJ9643704.1 hypothetical protein H2204_001849 [Knufia peltigerae]KIW39335.1 hypothetical protein PV06_09113 [Exophiala oligosperma]